MYYAYAGLIYFIFLFTKREIKLFSFFFWRHKWIENLHMKKSFYMKYYFTNIALQTIYFQHLIHISMFSYFTLLNYLLLFFLIYFSSQVNIFYLPLLKHILADFNRLAATLTFFRLYWIVFSNESFFFSFLIDRVITYSPGCPLIVRWVLIV